VAPAGATHAYGLGAATSFFRVLLQSDHGLDLRDSLLQPFQVMILDGFDGNQGSRCIDKGEPSRIENKAASFENAQLCRIDSNRDACSWD
jgi:hypothetical protein